MRGKTCTWVVLSLTTQQQYSFFFQAEDGIRDYKVTGVQTCALPILFREHPTDEMLKTGKGDDHAFRFTGAAAGEQDVKRCVSLQKFPAAADLASRKLCDLFGTEQHRCARACQDLLDAGPRQQGVDQHVRAAGFRCS